MRTPLRLSGSIVKPRSRARIAPLIFLVDTSESMSWPENGCPINAVNDAIEEALLQLNGIAKEVKDSNIAINIACLQFNDEAEWVLQRHNDTNILMDVETFKESAWKRLRTVGITNFCEALQKLNQLFKSPAFTEYKFGFTVPTVILITDGNPTDIEGDRDDGYLDELNILFSDKYFKRSTRIAIGYGNDVDKEVLQKFTGEDQKNNILMECDPEKLKNFIRLATLSATESSVHNDAFNIEKIIIK